MVVSDVVELIDLLQEKYDQNGLSEVTNYLRNFGYNPELFKTPWGMTYGISQNALNRIFGKDSYPVHYFSNS